MNRQHLTRVLCAVSLLLAVSPAAQATISHTWVASTGSDTNACTRSAPCATFAGALAKTSAGGEIDVADAGDYGPVTISQAVSIEAVGVLATIQVTSGNAITVTAGSSDVVVLRGLTLEGQGTATHGISFSTGGSLYVENCRINRFGTNGVNFVPTAASKLFVTDTITRNNGGSSGCGVYVQPGNLGFATASIDGLRTENNVCGVKGVDAVNITIRNSVAANNGFTGFTVAEVGNLPLMLIENSATVHNGTNGVWSNGQAPGSPQPPVIRMNNVTVTDNGTGLSSTGGGLILSFGNNKNDGNAGGNNGAPTSTISQQ
ncbi:MAG TPA: hypothetical protein VFE33_27610 [Thermoanaerobaculia bacterium]|nr:hypothetical protein [Thermoanaerobaculia bacterium]